MLLYKTETVDRRQTSVHKKVRMLIVLVAVLRQQLCDI